MTNLYSLAGTLPARCDVFEMLLWMTMSWSQSECLRQHFSQKLMSQRPHETRMPHIGLWLQCSQAYPKWMWSPNSSRALGTLDSVVIIFQWKGSPVVSVNNFMRFCNLFLCGGVCVRGCVFVCLCCVFVLPPPPLKITYQRTVALYYYKPLLILLTLMWYSPDVVLSWCSLVEAAFFQQLHSAIIILPI